MYAVRFHAQSAYDGDLEAAAIAGRRRRRHVVDKALRECGCNHGRRRWKKEGVWSSLELAPGLMPMQEGEDAGKHTLLIKLQA